MKISVKFTSKLKSITMYKIILSLIIVVLLLNVFASCSSAKKIETLKPEPDNASPLVYDNTPSFINIPVTVKIKDIENQTNKALTGLIFDDQDLEDDNLAIQVWKTAPITMQNQDGKLKTIVPLKAKLRYRYGINKFGISLQDTRELNLDGNVNLLSDVGLSNWKLHTNTSLESINWNQKPTISMGEKDVSINFLANTALKLFRKKIEKSIDAAIEDAIDFNPQVMQALSKLNAPMLISQQYNCWLQIVPIELYSTNAKFKDNDINIQLGLKCNINTQVGQKPAVTFDRNKISMKAVSQMPDRVTANIATASSYRDASILLKKNFNGKEFKDGKRKVTVQNVELWQKEGKMVVALDLIGSVNGTIYLTGLPEYDEKKQEIYFDQMDYVLDTKSRLIRTANWLASGYILKKIQDNCRYSIKPNLEEGKQNLLKYLKNYSPMPGVYVNGTLNNLDFKRIQLTNNAIVAFLTLDGQMNVSVDGFE